MDGILDKVMDDVNIMPWLHVINLKIDEIRKGNSTIRNYGATNNVEFLAVVSEFFFESPEKLKSEHPALYLALDNFFNEKTISRTQSSRKNSGGYNKGR
jgi:Mlc titration factor MtfA (ptsG expression regulator)